MLIFKLISQLATAFMAFAIGAIFVNGVNSIKEVWFSSSGSAVAADRKLSPGIYFTAPTIDRSADSSCKPSVGEFRPFGWNYDFPVSQMPEIARTARDGHWFFLETKPDNGRSFEFFGIVPDSVSTLGSQVTVIIPGKLIRISEGEITGNVEASYRAPACVFQ